MNPTDRISYVLAWLISKLLNAHLRPLWLKDKSVFKSELNALDCYPCRVGYSLGDFPQLWIMTPSECLQAHIDDECEACA